MKRPKRAKCKECEIRTEYLGAVVIERDYALADKLALMKEREVFVRFFEDINLILSGSRDTLCGSKWINAASLLEARNRYAKAMEEI